MTKPLEALIADIRKIHHPKALYAPIITWEEMQSLIAALEQSQHRVDELENDEVRQRLANAEHQLHMAGLRFHNIKASRNAQYKKRKAAEKRIAELEASQLSVKLPPHKYSECVSGLLEEAIAYSGTQHLRARLASRLSNFVTPGHEAGITVQGDE